MEKGHYTASNKRSYGINWANEFAKTMMQQAYKKGKIVQSWKRKIVFVIQDLAIEYLRSTSDCSLLTGCNQDYPVDFCTFSLSWADDNRWSLVFDKIWSTTIEGINRIIGGANVSEYLSVQEFIGNIVRKGVSDGVLQNNPYTRSLYEAL